MGVHVGGLLRGGRQWSLMDKRVGFVNKDVVEGTWVCKVEFFVGMSSRVVVVEGWEVVLLCVVCVLSRIVGCKVFTEGFGRCVF